MTRHIVLGNQSLLVNLDKWLQVRDIYYPHVGQENHLMGHAQRLGIYVDGKLSWVNENSWGRTLAYKPDSLATNNKATNKDLGIELSLEENVHCDYNLFLRKFTIKNTASKERDIKLFLNHDFHLYGDGVGDTAVYQADRNVVIHYKRSRYFLIGMIKGKGNISDMDEYAIGKAEGKDSEGTYRDAEDGILSKNPIAQGSVDSTIGVTLKIPANSSKSVYYYMAAGTTFSEVYELNDMVAIDGPAKLLAFAETCQRDWLKNLKVELTGLDKNLVELFKRSFLVIKTQTDKGGAIIAANDSDNTQFNKDTYSYMWPRDGAIVAMAMIKAGFPEFAKPFFTFCKDLLWEKGCMLHKYNPDGTLGSSWHPWVEDGKPSLPIQEDETALIIRALWEYYKATDDRAFVKELYKPLVKKAADFMRDYAYPNGLPKESYDLWEERRGVYTFTSCAVYSGLVAAEHLGAVFRDKLTCEDCHNRYESLKTAIISKLYNKKLGRFVRGVDDNALDSSLYALFSFGLLEADDPRVVATMAAIEKDLWASGKGGVARYEGDQYHRKTKKGPGNPWVICTLWLAKWHIARGNLNRAKELIGWTINCSLETGMMPEQVHPLTSESLSVSPLTWSHAEFIDTIREYQEKKKENGQ